MNIYESNYLLDCDIKKKLLEQARSTTVYRPYTTDRGTLTELYVSSDVGKGGIQPTVETEYLKSIINPKFKVNAVVFLKFMPNADIFPHTDDSILRTSCITWALSPEEKDFAPVIYHKGDRKDTIDEIKYYTDKPLILNTQKMHSMKNNSFERISIQLCITEPIEELAAADFNNELFVK